jgi:hypothetical protein
MVCDSEQQEEFARLKGRVVGLEMCLAQLHALVKAKAPSLLDENSGGNERLSAAIESMLSSDPTRSSL